MRDEGLEKSWRLEQYFDYIDGSLELQKFLELPVERGRKAEGEKYESRSYSHSYKVSLLNNSPCGVDIEVLDRKGEDWDIESPLFNLTMLAPGEKQLLKESKFAAHPHLPTLVWSSKEAMSKALGDAKRYDPKNFYSPIIWEQRPVSSWRGESLELILEDEANLIIWVITKAI